MKILIINKHYKDALGGSEIQCDIIARHLTKFGHEIFYLALGGEKKIYNTSYKVIPCKNFNVNKLNQVLDNVKPDIVYWRYNRRKLFESSRLIKSKNIKIVFSISSNRDIKPWNWQLKNEDLKPGISLKRINNFKKTIKKALIGYKNYLGYYWVDGVISLNSQYEGKVPVKKQITVHNSMGQVKEVFEWPRPYIVWVANIKEIKNPGLFIDLSKALQDTKVDFLMIGKIQDKKYEFLLDTDSTPSNFFYLGKKPVSFVNGVLENSLFLVHTCNPEGFGNNFIQAWLLGKPTISAFFDPDNLIANKELGLISGNYQQLVKDTEKLIKNKKLRLEMGMNAKEYALAHHDPAINTRKIENFFIHILHS